MQTTNSSPASGTETPAPTTGRLGYEIDANGRALDYAKRANSIRDNHPTPLLVTPEPVADATSDIDWVQAWTDISEELLLATETQGRDVADAILLALDTASEEASRLAEDADHQDDSFDPAWCKDAVKAYRRIRPVAGLEAAQGFPHFSGGFCDDRHCEGSTAATYDGHEMWKTAEAWARVHHADGEECPSPNGCDGPGCRKVAAPTSDERRDIVGLAVATGAGVQVTAERVEGLIKHFGSARVIAERDQVIHNHVLTDEGADMVRELAVAAEALTQAGVIAWGPVLVFRDEPALKTVLAEPGELPYEVADQEVSHLCAMRHDGQPTHGDVGWVEHEYSDTYGRDLMDLKWVPFYEIQLPGDTEPTRFCEDCMGWLTALAPHLLAGSRQG